MNNIPPDGNEFAAWEGYDHNLTDLENLVELKIEMGFLDDARELLEKVKQTR